MARKKAKVEATRERLVTTRLQLPESIDERLEECARQRLLSKAAFARWAVTEMIKAEERKAGKP
jgi:hypothetical protein